MNSRGNAYIYVLVLAALVSASTTAGLALISNSQNDLAVATAKYNQIALAADIASSLQLKELCMTTLTTTGFNVANPVPVQVRWTVADVPAGRPQRIDVDTQVPNYELIVDSLQFENIALVGALSPIRNLYSASLMMNSRSSTMEFQFNTLKVQDMYLEVENATVVGCYGRSDVLQVAADACVAIGAQRNADGSCSLKPRLPETRCPSGYYMQGFTAAGAPNCVVYP